MGRLRIAGQSRRVHAVVYTFEDDRARAMTR